MVASRRKILWRIPFMHTLWQKLFMHQGTLPELLEFVSDKSKDGDERIEVALEIARLNAYFCDSVLLKLICDTEEKYLFRTELVDIVLDYWVEAQLADEEICMRVKECPSDIAAYANSALLNICDMRKRMPPRETEMKIRNK